MPTNWREREYLVIQLKFRKSFFICYGYGGDVLLGKLLKLLLSSLLFLMCRVAIFQSTAVICSWMVLKCSVLFQDGISFFFFFLQF